MDLAAELPIIGRVLLAGLFGAIIGFERETMEKPAGLRTHMLVAAAAALFVEMGSVAVRHFAEMQQDELLRADPIRIIEAIATGISFIGAGTILFDRSKGRLEGITTAASVLMTAALGIAVGLRAYVVAGALTVAVALVLRVVGLLERRAGLSQHPDPDEDSSRSGEERGQAGKGP